MAGADLSGTISAPSADAGDIQGILRAGYGTLSEASFLLLRIVDAGAARAWLGQAPITTVGHLDRHMATALQVALTADGMRALGVADNVIAGFSAEFVAGMAGEEARSRRLGDVGANAPSRWRWGAAERVPDALAMLYAEQGLASWRQRIATDSFRRGFAIIEELATSNMGGREPFGFMDGVSQPYLDWSGNRRPGTDADLEYGNLIAPGEFLLGYRNEYGLYTDRPLLDAARPGAPILPPAEDDPARRDLGRNGCYLVFRELHQDVRAFWRFVAAQDGAPAMLAEAMVGRQMSGEPLIAAGTRPIPGVGPDAVEIRRNRFTYGADKDGLRCPLGAHVRRANPRTADMPGGRQGRLAQLVRMLGFGRVDLQDDLIAASRFHRILRRGREFGDMLSAEEAMRPDVPDPQSGLHFIGVGANIARQFEFVQNAWLASAKFGGLSGEADPLTGNRVAFPANQPTDGFSLSRPNGVRRRIGGMPQFVTVRGGGYFFLPGLRALRYLAGAGAGT